MCVEDREWSNGASDGGNKDVRHVVARWWWWGEKRENIEIEDYGLSLYSEHLH